MTRALLVVVALAVIATLTFATCGDRPDPQDHIREGVNAPTEPDIVPRKWTDGSIAEEEPAEAAEPVARTKDEATTEFRNTDTRPAVPKHVLRGRVLNARSEPIEGAEVVLVSQWLPHEIAAIRPQPAAVSRMTTGADGAFALDYWEGGTRALEVLAAGVSCSARGVGDDKFHEVVLPEQMSGVVVVRVTSASDG